ncbi:hypothetical protein K502DRAFT_321955 [Neoconidiobolus thromboides FSU 785]|nr:hypothetical protein K502DRAFT_321955 [Neoconidiobolus thromboides FSU 785]
MDTEIKEQESAMNQDNFLHILVVGFHHLKGPVIEYAYPSIPGSETKTYSTTPSESIEDKRLTEESLSDTNNNTYIQLPQNWSFLPFAALPDGSHQSNTGSSFFTLPPLDVQEKAYQQTLFAISKFQQIETEKIINKTSDMSRSFVQKAIVVITKNPTIGIVNEKLSQVTMAYFEQLDFANLDIFKEFFTSLKNIKYFEDVDDDILYSGLPIPEFIKKFGENSLKLLKLLLLQKKVLFYGTMMEKVGLYQFCLLSLLGDTMRHLAGSASVEYYDLKLRENNEKLKESKEISEIINNFNPPIFDEYCVFQPCLTLQQFDEFSSSIGESNTKSFLVGTTNQLFELKSDFYDVRVDVDTGEIKLFDNKLEGVLNLTSADIKFMNELLLAANQHSSNSVSNESSFVGSDTYLRQKYFIYYQSLAASVLYSQKLKLKAQVDTEFKEEYQDRVTSILDEFNLDFVNLWAKAPNFKSLIQYITKDSMFELDIDTLGHPGHGATIFDSIQIKLASQIKNIKLEENLTPVVQKLGQAGERLSKVFSGLYHDLQNPVGGTATAISTEGKSQRDIEKKEEIGSPAPSTTTGTNETLKNTTQQAQKLMSGFSSWFQSAKKQVSAQIESWEIVQPETGTSGTEMEEKTNVTGKNDVFAKSKYYSDNKMNKGEEHNRLEKGDEKGPKNDKENTTMNQATKEKEKPIEKEENEEKKEIVEKEIKDGKKETAKGDTKEEKKEAVESDIKKEQEVKELAVEEKKKEEGVKTKEEEEEDTKKEEEEEDTKKEDEVEEKEISDTKGKNKKGKKNKKDNKKN